MAKPTSSAEWGTDPSADIVDPAGAELVGWIPATRPAPGWFNWWQNIVYTWLDWLGDTETIFELVPLSNAVIDPDLWETYIDNAGTRLTVMSLANSKPVYIRIPTINLATLSAVNVWVQPGAHRTGADRVSVGVYKENTSAPKGTLALVGSLAYDDGTDDEQSIDLAPALTMPTSSAVETYYIGITAGNTGAAVPDFVFQVAIQGTRLVAGVRVPW